MFYFFSTSAKKILAFLIAALQSSLGVLGIYTDCCGVRCPDTAISYDFEYSTEKVFEKDFIGRDSSFEMHLAKNEREDCQLVVRNRYSSEKKISVEIGEFSNGNGDTLPCELFEVRFICYTADSAIEYPDALVPYDGSEITVQPHSNQPFFIEVRSGKDTQSGTYTAAVTISETLSDGSKKAAAQATVTANVWNFILPDKPSCATAMGISSSSFYPVNGIFDRTKPDEYRDGVAVYKQYYDFLLDHKISAYNLPYDIMSAEAESYMNDERVTSFLVGYYQNDDKLKDYYDRVSSNETWADKAFYYPIDEPKDAEAYATYNTMTDRLSQFCPGYNMVTPFNRASVLIDGKIQSSALLQKGRSSIICPVSNLLGNKTVRDQIKARQEQGDRAWWYVCCKPLGDYCNFHMSNNGLCHRILFWQQKLYGITGLLYWNTVYWDKCQNPWESSKTWNAVAPGDGSLIYPGRVIGIDLPIASLRLKGVTNGIEDYEYFALAEELLGSGAAEDTIKKVTTSLTAYTLSDEKFESVRVQLGNAIEKAAEK